MIEEGYHNTNPYHNSIHAADVTQAMYCFLREPKVSMMLTLESTATPTISKILTDNHDIFFFC